MKVTHEEAKTAINKMSLGKIMSFNAFKARALTDDFKDDLLTDIVYKGTSDKERLDVIRWLNQQHYLIYAKRRPTPQILNEMSMRVEFELPLTPTPTPAEPAEPSWEHKKLKAEHEALKAKYGALKEQLAECQSQPKASGMQEAENDEWIVELFSHFCYEDTQVAKSILDEIRGKEDPVIADIIMERKAKNEISPKTQNREMWRVLHAAKLYRGIEGNFNTALRRRQQR